jgi:threonine/homoserine/homoserine lactone efflux protein
MTAAIVLLAIPGPAVLYIVMRSVDQGPKAGLASTTGIATGSALQVLAAAFGLSALLASSIVAYSVVKYAGAVYLVYLGIKKLRERVPAEEIEHRAPLSLSRIYAQGVVVETLNPKSALFFIAFLPQFVDPARGPAVWQFLALGLIFVAMGLVSDSVWALTAGSAAGWLKRSKAFARNQKYVSGTVYIGLGLATAVSSAHHSSQH